MERVITEIYEQKAQILKNNGITRRCEWFDSFKIANQKDMAKSVFHRTGIQFCQRYNFPSIDLYQRMSQIGMEQYGWYVDAGDIELHNPKEVLLVGNTNATIHSDKDGCKIIVMHNAKANITISGTSIAQIFYNDGCSVEYRNEGAGIVYVSKDCAELKFSNR